MMNSQKLVFFSVVACGLIALTYGLSCYNCDNVNSCKNPKKTACSQATANATRNWLDLYYKNVNMNITSTTYTCMSDYFKASNTEYRYKGCLYSNINACQLSRKDYLTQGTVQATCSQCNNKDYCNPAARASINSVTVLATIAAALIGKFLWSH